MRKAILSSLITLFFLSSISPTFAFNPAYRFTDQEKDTESGLYNFDARGYNPGIGRFIQPDPVLNELNWLNNQKDLQNQNKQLQRLLMNPQRWNSYSYTVNNPIKYVDPQGESVMEVIRGEQSLSQFQVEIGENAEIRYQDNGIWKTVLDNPYLFGGAMALTTPLIAAGINALFGGTSLLANLGLTTGALPQILISQSQRIFNGSQELKNKTITPGALTKLQNVADIIGKRIDSIFREASKSKSVFTDLRHGGNVNIFFQNPINTAKLIRVTLDPTLDRIISAGFNTIKQVTEWINEGKLINYIK